MAEKHTSGSWTSIPYRKYSIDTDTITSFPKTIIGDGTAVSAYTVKGNMEQSGTPTPSAPIYPSECGERAENLLNTSGAQSGYINADGSIVQGHENLMYTDYIPIPENASAVTQTTPSYTMSSPAMCFYDSAKNYISGEAFASVTPKTFTVPNGAKFLRTCYRNPSYHGITMLNEGSTALPYQPYGYQIPLTLGNTATNIYLGEVQSTRNVKKLVPTGEENWYYSSGTFYFNVVDLNSKGLRKTTFYCSHYEVIDDGRAFADLTNNSIYTGAGGLGGTYVYIFTDAYTTTTDFKAYLAQQYANGTPVTIWYPLKTETTSIVNEPLRKIGTYTDSVSGSGLPTSGQAESLDVGTTLKPSEVDLTYHGWHEKRDKVYTNGSWVENV